MQVVASTQRTAVAKAAPAARVASVRAPLRVSAKLNVAEVAKKASVFAATLPAMIVSSPAWALVDDRMNGDGTGRPFGVNEPVLGWVIVGVAGTMWALWFNGQRDLGDFEDPEDGLNL